jgi:DNA-binding SARP family transcriptional activator
MPKLTIHVLGGISITREGRHFEDKLSHKSLAILSLLLTAPGMRMAKPRVTALLWADSDPDAAKSNLRFNLWSIRKIIGTDAQGADLILSDREFIRLNPRYLFESDILAVKAFKNGSAMDAASLIPLRQYFKGEYMEGFYLDDCEEYAEIILMERMACQNIRADILEAVYDRLAAHGDLRGAVQIMLETLRIDPFNETCACRILQHMEALKQVTQAIGFYQDFAIRLRKDLNIAPSEQLQSQYKHLLDIQCQPTDQQNSPMLSPNAMQAGAPPPVGSPRSRRSAAALSQDAMQPTPTLLPAKSPPHRNAPKESSGGPLKVQIRCIPDIAYFWMAECIDILNARLDEASKKQVPRRVTADLAWIYPAFSEVTDPAPSLHEQKQRFGRQQASAVPDIRLFYALRDYLAHAAQNQSLEIITENRDSIDCHSRAFLEFIAQKPLGRIRFKP